MLSLPAKTAIAIAKIRFENDQGSAHISCQKSQKGQVLEDFDIIIIGAGIVGVSAASFLAPYAKLLILEREDDVFYHSSSRSTSQYTVGIHAPIMRRLAQASREFLTNPDKNFSEAGFLTPRGCLAVGTVEQKDRLLLLQSYLQDAKARCELIGQDDIRTLLPALREDHFQIGVYEPDAMDIDSDKLMNCYLRKVKKHGR